MENKQSEYFIEANEENRKVISDIVHQMFKKGITLAECDFHDNYEIIKITFKSGDTISYRKGEWDDYAYDGKAIMVKRKGAWIGIYNFDDVFCVELN